MTASDSGRIAGGKKTALHGKWPYSSVQGGRIVPRPTPLPAFSRTRRRDGLRAPEAGRQRGDLSPAVNRKELAFLTVSFGEIDLTGQVECGNRLANGKLGCQIEIEWDSFHMAFKQSQTSNVKDPELGFRFAALILRKVKRRSGAHRTTS